MTTHADTNPQALTERLSSGGLTLDQLVLPVGAGERLIAALGQGQALADHPTLAPALAGWLAGAAAPAGCLAAISGPQGTGRTALARALGLALGLPVVRMRKITDGLPDLGAISAEITYHRAMLLVDGAERWLGPGQPGAAALAEWLPGLPCPVVLTCRDLSGLPASLVGVLQAHVALRWPSPAEREWLWEQHLVADLPLEGDVDLPELARAYPMPGAGIARAVRLAVQMALASPPPQITSAHLHAAARGMAEAAALTISACPTQASGLEDLVLPGELSERMGDLLRTVRARQRLGLQNARGLQRALVVLIDGAAGTGKSLAAHAMAAELGLPLLRFRDSLPGQPPLLRVRDLVRRGAETGALLLIDDAETLLGRRGQEPAQGGDRHSALELDDLLALLDEHDGPLVWTTRSVGALDPAALRAVHTRMTLSEPGPAQRVRLLQAFLQRAKLICAADVDLEALAAAYALTGGRLRNAVARAAGHSLAEGAAAISLAHLQMALGEEAQAAGVVVWTQAGRKPSHGEA